jgi:hypothetical protein
MSATNRTVTLSKTPHRIIFRAAGRVEDGGDEKSALLLEIGSGGSGFVGSHVILQLTEERRAPHEPIRQLLRRHFRR